MQRNSWCKDIIRKAPYLNLELRILWVVLSQWRIRKQQEIFKRGGSGSAFEVPSKVRWEGKDYVEKFMKDMCEHTA